MKKILTIFGLLLMTSLSGQTSEIELNYANGGYIELQKMGIDSKEGYVIEETGLEIKERFPRGDGPYKVLKLVREENGSIAAVMLAQDGQKPIFVVIDPKTRTKQQYVQNSAIMGTGIDVEDDLAKMLQTIYWPE